MPHSIGYRKSGVTQTVILARHGSKKQADHAAAALSRKYPDLEVFTLDYPDRAIYKNGPRRKRLVT